ncbi:hypothetical protein KTT_06980 [Tengunoibacter tsumagoiensis]|uniref:Sensor protein KdpD transmembrane domain-containing protein n=1 Tax=Tengunoibacter tsumagoiensis TaxID=2014871 RepID=A0A401ZVA0_9CHLR|nr:hypothetical protein KTT_06980 [Tengunoibacter tsumagoiensis]
MFTGTIYFAHIYPTIPNASILYLLLIVPLALLRGALASILASFLATLSFDYFMVPPIYTFRVASRVELVELLGLLLVALVISLLTSTIKRGSERMWIRERQARLLYEFLWVTHETEQLDDQLQEVALAIVRIFANWGVHSCGIFLPDAQGVLTLQASAPVHHLTDFALSPHELREAENVFENGQSIELERNVGHAQLIRLVPLRNQQEILGVVGIQVTDLARWRANAPDVADKGLQYKEEASYFWAFLDRAAGLVERSNLRAQLHYQDDRTEEAL